MAFFLWITDGKVYGAGMTAQEATEEAAGHLKANGDLMVKALFEDDRAEYPPAALQQRMNEGVIAAVQLNAEDPAKMQKAEAALYRTLTGRRLAPAQRETLAAPEPSTPPSPPPAEAGANGVTS